MTNDWRQKINGGFADRSVEPERDDDYLDYTPTPLEMILRPGEDVVAAACKYHYACPLAERTLL